MTEGHQHQRARVSYGRGQISRGSVRPAATHNMERMMTFKVDATTDTLPAQDEILARYKDRATRDFFGFEVTEYLLALDFEHAKPFLKNEVTEWEPRYKSRQDVLNAMEEYASFAWNKANNRRGLSAGRSLAHYVAWLWLIGEHDLADSMDDYTHYGKPQLVRICEKFGWDWRQWDDDKWTNYESETGVPANTVLGR